jgi:hypothetical protein
LVLYRYTVILVDVCWFLSIMCRDVGCRASGGARDLFGQQTA